MKYRFGGRLGKFLAGLLVSAAVAGCVRDDTDPLAGPDAGSSGELRIAFSIDGMEAVTRAVATDPHERNLKDVHVLFFTQDGNYITYQHANVSAGSSYVSFPIPKGLTAGESYRTLAFSNAIAPLPAYFSPRRFPRQCKDNRSALLKNPNPLRRRHIQKIYSCM